MLLWEMLTSHPQWGERLQRVTDRVEDAEVPTHDTSYSSRRSAAEDRIWLAHMPALTSLPVETALFPLHHVIRRPYQESDGRVRRRAHLTSQPTDALKRPLLPRAPIIHRQCLSTSHG